MSTGWLIGYIIGGVVVILVVALLLVLIFTARKIGTQADEIEAALATARDRTQALWAVEQINARVTSIRHRLSVTRRELGG